MPELNPEIHYLGTLCKCGHEYLDTDRSLRYVKGHHCFQCQSEKRKCYQKNNRKKLLFRGRKYSQSISGKEVKKKYRKKHRKERQLQAKEYARKNTEALSDVYVKSQLRKSHTKNSEDITPKIIELKRIQLKFRRERLKGEEALNEIY